MTIEYLTIKQVLVSVVLWLCLSTTSIAAPESKNSETNNLDIELNAQAQQGAACRVSFVLKNNMRQAITGLEFELVLFDNNQQVKSILVINVGTLPVGKTRVRQYGLKNVDCTQISRFLLNDIKVCEGAGLTPQSCLTRLNLSSRTSTKFGS